MIETNKSPYQMKLLGAGAHCIVKFVAVLRTLDGILTRRYVSR